MDFYISVVSVKYTKKRWFKKTKVEELVSVGISTEHGTPLIVSLKGLDYWGMPVEVREFVLNGLREDHELPTWMFDDFDNYLCVDYKKAAALIESYINHFSSGRDNVYALRPQDDWHFVSDFMVTRHGLSFPLCLSLDQMLFEALYDEKMQNLDRLEHRSLIRHEEFPKGYTLYCKDTMDYTIQLHKFLKKHA